MFSGRITYKVGYGKYRESDSSWQFIEVPAPAAGRETAQTVRKNAGAESARMFAYDENGREVYWYFSVNYADGGGSSYAEHTELEAKAALERIRNNEDAMNFSVTRHTVGTEFIQRIGFHRDEDDNWVT